MCVCVCLWLVRGGGGAMCVCRGGYEGVFVGDVWGVSLRLWVWVCTGVCVCLPTYEPSDESVHPTSGLSEILV